MTKPIQSPYALLQIRSKKKINKLKTQQQDKKENISLMSYLHNI